MSRTEPVRSRVTLEVMLVIVVVGMAALFIRMGEHRLLALNLFYLPVIVSGFFLGRFSAGVLALFSAIAVTIASLLFPNSLATYTNPLHVAIVLTLWSAVLGLSAIMIGTLCDERAATVSELKRAYVGIAEVLSRYLHGNDPRNESRVQRVARLCHMIAEALRLPPKEVDDIRVAALLYDLGEVEITTTLITRAVDSLEEDNPHARRTFTGGDLVHSLGEVLHGAVPLLVNQDEGVMHLLAEQRGSHEIPFGVHVIRAARIFDHLSFDAAGRRLIAPAEVIKRMRMDASGAYALVLDVLERVLNEDRSEARRALSRFEAKREPGAGQTRVAQN